MERGEARKHNGKIIVANGLWEDGQCTSHAGEECVCHFQGEHVTEDGDSVLQILLLVNAVSSENLLS